MRGVVQDFRYAFRLLRVTPGLAVLAVMSLGIGIAASTTIFSVIHTVLLAPPVFKNTSRLVILWESNKSKGIPKTAVAPATFNDWRNHSTAFEKLELVAPGSPVTVTGSGLPQRANIQYATPGLFHLLGVQPVLGRTFSDFDETSADNPVILTYGFWQNRLGSDPAIVGKPLIVNGIARTVVGVLPKGFNLFDPDTNLWIPIAFPDLKSQDRTFRVWLIAVGRFKPGVRLRSAQAQMDLIGQQIAQAHPDSNNGWTIKLEPIQEAQYGDWKPILYPLFGIVLCVLLISCANIANLLLGRLSTRAREMSIRASLGASRSRLIAQVLIEGILISFLGCAMGVALTFPGIQLFLKLAPAYFPFRNEIRINSPVLLFCVLVSLFSGVALAAIPALVGTRASVNEAFKSATKRLVGRGHAKVRNLFAVTQISLAVMLLLGAGLMIRSLLKLVNVDAGFRADEVVTMQIFLSGPKYFHWTDHGVTIYQATDDFYTRLLDRINTLPGVDSAAVVSWLPMEHSTGRRERMFQISGHAQSDPLHKPVSNFNTISAGYFHTLRIPLLEGRNFTPGDNSATPWVAIVNQAFARRYLANENQIGRILITDGEVGERPRDIIGVVADVHQDTLEKQPEPEIYTPFLQQPAVASGHGYQNRVHMNVVIHISGDANSTIASVRKIAGELDSNQPIYDVQTLPDVVAETTALNRLHASLLEIFAAAALLLSAIGIYGSMCQTVNERTAEIALRIAVGATTSDLYRLILLRGLKLVSLGLLVGLLLASLFERVLTSVLFGVTPYDPISLIAVCSLLFAVAMVAISIPARRAMRVDPITALHYE